MDLKNEQKNRKTPEALFKPEKGIFTFCSKVTLRQRKTLLLGLQRIVWQAVFCLLLLYKVGKSDIYLWL